jgi:hypothetical protein
VSRLWEPRPDVSFVPGTRGRLTFIAIALTKFPDQNTWLQIVLAKSWQSQRVGIRPKENSVQLQCALVRRILYKIL